MAETMCLLGKTDRKMCTYGEMEIKMKISVPLGRKYDVDFEKCNENENDSYPSP